jgi:hypothetical protein
MIAALDPVHPRADRAAADSAAPPVGGETFLSSGER